jgi:general secretion pathway protein L
MKQQLVIQLGALRVDADSVVDWHLFDAGGGLERGDRSALGSLRVELGAALSDCETVVLVPGELVFLTSAHIPSRQVRQIKQALPYMVEELIADNIEDVHLAIPEIKPGDERELPVGVVQHHLLIDWLDQLYQHGITADILCPDTLAVPWRQGSHSFFAMADRVVCRDGAYRGQVIARAQFDNYLQLLKHELAERELGAPLRHMVYCGADDLDAGQAVCAAVQAAVDAETTLTEYAETGAEVVAVNAMQHSEELLNLLQGGYKVQRRGQDERQWARVAAVAGIGLVLYCAIAGASGAWFAWQADKVEAQTFSLYRELFPGERRVVSPKKQMQAHLGGGSSAAGASPLPLLAKAALGLRGNQLQIDELHYRRQRNDLQLQLHTPTLETLDQIKTQLGGVGLNVEINSATQQGSGAVGRLNIRDGQS